jgi:hypothetical protein
LFCPIKANAKASRFVVCAPVKLSLIDFIRSPTYYGCNSLQGKSDEQQTFLLVRQTLDVGIYRVVAGSFGNRKL